MTDSEKNDLKAALNEVADLQFRLAQLQLVLDQERQLSKRLKDEVQTFRDRIAGAHYVRGPLEHVQLHLAIAPFFQLDREHREDLLVQMVIDGVAGLLRKASGEEWVDRLRPRQRE